MKLSRVPGIASAAVLCKQARKHLVAYQVGLCSVGVLVFDGLHMSLMPQAATWAMRYASITCNALRGRFHNASKRCHTG